MRHSLFAATARMLRAKFAAALLALPIAHALCNVAYSQEKSTTIKLDLVQPNSADQPRSTPMTRAAMKQYLEDLKYRPPRIPLPELTEEDKKRQLEDPRSGGYEPRLRSSYLVDSTNAYLTFGGSPARGFPGNPNRPNNPVESKLTLDYGFKVRLFWIAARVNNCQYCLGHQESKLLAVGMSEDSIAALDSDWEQFPANEQVAFALAKRLTNQPYLISDKDIDACRPFYTDLQMIEMIGSIAGNNAINRWKEGAGIPQSANGGNFGASREANQPSASSATSTDEHSYLTPTSDRYASTVSKVAVLQGSSSPSQSSPTRYSRPPLETGAQLAEKLQWATTRIPRLPLADKLTTRQVMGELVTSESPTQWLRLLAHFPVAGKRLADGVAASRKSDELDALLQAKIDWVVARQDGAWYMAAIAKQDLERLGQDSSSLAGLDGDLSQASSLTDRERALLTVAKNVAASPIVLTDKQAADAVKIAGPRAVTQVINYTCYRAALDRITEAAGLSLKEID